MIRFGKIKARRAPVAVWAWLVCLSAWGADLNIRRAAEVEFLAREGNAHQIQSSPDGAVWLDEGPPIEGDGAVRSHFVSLKSEATLFLRVVSVALTPRGGLLSHTTCKNLLVRPNRAPANEECLRYAYDGAGLLELTHLNAGFNCCPDALIADIDIDLENRRITIVEEEVFGTPCRCLCLYDLQYEIRYLPPATYRLEVVGPYPDRDGGPVSFTVDLISAPSGQHCVKRTVYPWGP